MKVSKKIFVLIFLISVAMLLPAVSVLAGCDGSSAATDPSCGLPNPLGETDPSIIIGRVIQGILGVVGSIALVMFIYGGFTWMTASGNTEKVTKGKDIILWSILGLIVIFTSFALVTFVIKTVSGTT